MTETTILDDRAVSEIEARAGDKWTVNTDTIRALCATVKHLRTELAEEKRLRAELKQIAQIGISEVSSVGTMLKDNAVIDFRLRAIQLCKDKAAESDGLISSVPDKSVAFQSGKATAFRELEVELGQLT